MKNKQFIKDGKKNPVRDYRSVETITATPTLQSVRTATKSRGLQAYGLQNEGWFFFLPSDANLTACFFKNNLL
ncbi:MAG: hypothetical protein LBT56_05550 [Prevotellaceae bacterium]|jgi:hypothetical protein|nr:hypothetical protein [Prevotellaceae bacterium]